MKAKKIEFSKLIVTIVLLVWISSMIFSFYEIHETKDTSPLAYIIPSVEATAAVCLGFYFNKAKTENALKNMKKYHLDEKENFNINNYESDN